MAKNSVIFVRYIDVVLIYLMDCIQVHVYRAKISSAINLQTYLLGNQ